MPFKIVDCTLRDGGYYTNWDFPQKLVDAYFDAVRSLGIAYVEVGYRSPEKNAYFGKYFHMGLSLLKACKSALRPDQGLAIMFNYKDVTPALIDELTSDLLGTVDLVRFACPPDAIAECVELGRRIKSRGIKVAINVMYMTKYTGDVSVLEPLASADDVVDYVALVDSYGGVLPEQAADTFRKAVDLLPQPLGFHGHDNLSLAFANSLEALKAGATMLDSTFTGMGRGAGNLKTELITVYRENLFPTGAHFGKLAKALDLFEALQREYGWGTNLAYMVSGSALLPQADVMDWLGTRRYQMDSIVEALRLSSDTQLDVAEYPDIATSAVAEGARGKPVLIIGGGASVAEHAQGIVAFAKAKGALVVHSSMRNTPHFADCETAQVHCLAGQEFARLSPEQIAALSRANTAIVAPPPPRFRDAVPEQFATFQVGRADSPQTQKLGPVTDEPPLDLAIAVATSVGASEIYLAGFDGYESATLSQQNNAADVQQAIDRAKSLDTPWGGNVKAVTPTLYAVRAVSLYAQLQVGSN